MKATHHVICLGATDLALGAAIFCSLTNGGGKLEIFSYREKFGFITMLTILAAAKNFAIKPKTKDIYTATKVLYKITVSCASATTRLTHHYSIVT